MHIRRTQNTERKSKIQHKTTATKCELPNECVFYAFDRVIEVDVATARRMARKTILDAIMEIEEDNVRGREKGVGS